MFLTPLHQSTTKQIQGILLVKLEKGTTKRMLTAANSTDTTTAQFES